MTQQQQSPHDLSARLHHPVIPSRARAATHIQPALRGESAGTTAAGPRVRVRRNAIRQVVLLEVEGRLGEVVQDLDRAIQLALAEGPRGVVCNLSGVLEGPEPGSVEVLATAGRHVRDWPAIPVAIACPDPEVRATLAAHPLGRHLIVTESMLPALSAVLETDTQTVERLRLAPHPTAPRASRDFVTRTLLDWHLGRVIRCANLAVTELVFSSIIHAGTDIEVSVAWSLGAIRLTVQDNSPSLPTRPPSATASDRGRHSLAVVDGLSRAFGVLPTFGGGKVVWAVLTAFQPRHPQPATGPEESLILTGSPCPTSPPVPTPAALGAFR